MQLYFANRIGSDQIFLDEEESHHSTKVMRHHPGDILMVTDGIGKLYRGKIVRQDKKESTLELLEIIQTQPAPVPQIHIAIAPTKNIDRFEWFLEKVTETGITEITPVICRRSERDKIKKERLAKIVNSAMKQSLQLWLPKLNDMIMLQPFIKYAALLNSQKLICHCQGQELPSLKDSYKADQDVLILVGPEGDFTEEEINLAERNNFESVTLGKSRLRTETAGIIAVHTVHVMND